MAVESVEDAGGLRTLLTYVVIRPRAWPTCTTVDSPCESPCARPPCANRGCREAMTRRSWCMLVLFTNSPPFFSWPAGVAPSSWPFSQHLTGSCRFLADPSLRLWLKRYPPNAQQADHTETTDLAVPEVVALRGHTSYFVWSTSRDCSVLLRTMYEVLDSTLQPVIIIECLRSARCSRR